MKELRIDILSDAVILDDTIDAIGIPTNGNTKKNGEAVMGAGVAKLFKERFKFLPKRLGEMLTQHGNRVHVLDNFDNLHIFSFPTKRDWRDRSDLLLIDRSARELRQVADHRDWNKIYLPRPGCGLGGLSWKDVKKVLELYLDDRFTICFV